ncbi:MAG: type II secretion system F family protein [Burkholderiaceae bacterium]
MTITVSLMLWASVTLFVFWLTPWILSIFAAQEGVLRTALEQHNRYLQRGTVRLIAVTAAFVLGGILFLLSDSLLAFPIGGLAVVIAMPPVLRWLKSRQRRQLQQSLPEFCDLIAASLQSGSSLRASIVRAEQSVDGPLRQELHQLLRDIRLGHSTDHAFAFWAERIRLPALQDLAFCVRLSAQTGGNLAEALIRLGDSFRQQIALEAKAAALTAQGRLQAVIMLAMPPLLFIATSALDPFVSEFFLGTPLGLALITLTATLEVLGVIWVRRIVRFEV